MISSSDKIEQIFSEALQLASDEERSAYLERACGADLELRHLVEKLLRAQPKAAAFLEQPSAEPRADVEKPPPGLMAIFDQAVEIASPAEREAYLNAACAAAPELKQKVDGLLSAYENARDSQVSTLDTPILEGPGTVIGPYKLQEQIGAGGFGVVFMAEQKEPIRRKVALKVVKPGMDTKEVIARFEAERQALALMDHPNIAKVLDAGQTSSGRPYFVMDLVKGVPITKFCDESQLTLKERLELFMHVCKAVQHAHQKGIIHRDIKPSNVLVTMQDGVPLVKVIDFGIAKALGQQLTDKTFFTGFAQMIGTPLYMSPEQAALSNVDVDTRSDIYSLGVLLYELLTGTTPIDRKRLHEAAYDEIRRIIREEEPPMPSTRMSTLGQEASAVSAQRKSDPKRLSRLFRGELDWIVMKALDKDRNRRFETANSFADDIQRYLANEPVLAGPPTARYRLRKFVRRHRTGLLVAVVVISALVVVLTVVAGSVGWVIGERSARETEITRRVRDVMVLARSLVADNQPSQALQRLDIAKAMIARDREALPDLTAELDVLVADLVNLRSFLDLIDQAHEAETSNLGHSPQRGMLLLKALACYDVLDREAWFAPLEQSALVKQQAKQIRRTVYEELLWLANSVVSGWPDPRAQPQSAGVNEWDAEANAAFLRNRNESAAQGALAYLRSAEKAYPCTHWFYQLRAECHKMLGKVEEARKDEEAARQTPPTTAIDYFFQGQAAAQRSSWPDAVKALQNGLRLEPTHFWSLMLLGNCLMEQGAREPHKIEAAIAVYTGCISRRPDYSRAYFERGLANKMLGWHEEAKADFARAGPSYEQRWITQRWIMQGNLYTELRQWDEALTEYSKAIEFSPTKQGLVERARVYVHLGRLDKAITDYSAALERSFDPGALDALSIIYLRREQWDKAIVEFSKIIERMELGNPAYPKVAFVWDRRGEFYGRLGQWDKAKRDHSQAIELYGKGALGFNNRGLAYANLGHREEALADFSKALESDKYIPLVWSSEGYYANHNLGLFEKARAELTKAIALKPKEAYYPNALAWLMVAHADPKVRDPRRALELAQTAVELEPKNGEYLSTLGAAQYRAEDWQGALASLEKSMKLKTGKNQGGNSYNWLIQAMAHWQLGHKAEARKVYDRAVNWMKSLPNNLALKWTHAKGLDTDEIRSLRAEAANLLGIQE